MSGRNTNFGEFADDDTRMNAAIVEARSTVGTLIEALKNPILGSSGFAVKMALQSGSGTEHVWVNRVTYDGELFHGVVNNPPASATGLKLGDPVTARPGDISDWMYLRGRRLVGGHTIRAVRDGMSAEERKEFDETSPFIFQAASEGAIRAPSELVGIWDLISTDSGGGPTSRPGIHLVITEDFISMVSTNGAIKPMGDIAGANLTTQPKEIDLSNGGKIGRGIFELNGDNLKLIVPDPSQTRPTEFKGQRGAILFSLKRRR